MTFHGLVVLLATAVALPAALFAALPVTGDQLALFSQYLGTVSLALMAWAQIWATRAPGVEAVFGGLDRVYVLHKWTAISALLAMLVHDTVDAEINGLTEWPLRDLGETLGEVGLYGIIALSLLSVTVFVPYHLWRWTHRFMGALFVAAGAHVLMIDKPFGLADPLGLYLVAVTTIGTLSYLVTLLPRRGRAYAVEQIAQSGGAVSVTLAPEGRPLTARPGQFVSVAFDAPGLGEAHPFTLSAPVRDDGRLQITAKPLGDHTSRWAAGLEPGTKARITGPFGRFSRRDGARAEVWVAAGIGITPFLAWTEALGADQTGRIDLVWAVRSEAEAPHLDRLRAAADRHPALHLTLIDSTKGDRLTPERLAEAVPMAGTRLAFCGPEGLRRSLSKGLKARGLPHRFRHEVFEFRSGLGLRRLLGWAGARLPRMVRVP